MASSFTTAEGRGFFVDKEKHRKKCSYQLLTSRCVCGIILTMLFRASVHLQSVYFSKCVYKPAKLKVSFASILGEMYPVRLCIHILPGVSWHDRSRFLAGPIDTVFGSVRHFFLLSPQCHSLSSTACPSSG